MKTTSKRRIRKARNLALEAFERRALLAGNVTALVDDGNLVIAGDASANGVALHQTDAGRYVITGFDLDGTTTINGGTAPVVLEDVTGDVVVDLRAGDDSLVVSNSAEARQTLADSVSGGAAGTIADSPEVSDPSVDAEQVAVSGNLLIQTGAGDDGVGLNVNVGSDTGGGFVRIDTGDGADTVEVSGSAVGSDLTLNAGAEGDDVTLDDVEIEDALFASLRGGDDSYTANGVAAAQIGLFAGAGGDQIELIGSTSTEETVLFTGIGDDELEVTGLTSADLTVNTGGGDDLFNLTDAEVAGAALLSMGAGADEATIDQLSVEDSLIALLGAGADSLKIRNSDASDAFLNGGLDTDTLDLGSTNDLGKTTLNSFENKLTSGNGGKDKDNVRPGHGYGDRNHEHVFQHEDRENRGRRDRDDRD
jgi:hypothetical protein